MQKDSSRPAEKVIPLTFGAIISLSPPESSDSFIYVDGFIKDKIMIKNFDHIDSKPHYSKSLFQIYPSFINTYKKEALALRDPANLDKTPPGHRRIAMINGLQDKVSTEFNFNLETFKKVTGQPVLFGQTIQLLHVSSNKFLACRNTEADIERENYKVSLDEFSSDVTMFKFLPCYKHQKESEGIIYIDDSIYIASTNAMLNKTPFLHISTPTTVSIRKRDQLQYMNGNTKGENDGLESGRNEMTTKPRFKIEVNASLESQTRLKINYYTNYQPETTSFLECGDIVWLNHSELNATLVCITEFKNNLFDHRIEFDISNVMENFKRFVGNTNGMWLIEHSEYKKGGLVRWGQPYRFKHLSSGLYLSTKMGKKKGDKQVSAKIILEREPNEDNLFTFIPVSGAQATDLAANKVYVTKDTFVLITQKKTDLILQATLSKEHTSKKTAKQTEENMSLVSQTKPCMISPGAGSEEATFKIIKANYNEVWETNFLISCFPLLKGFLESITILHYKASTAKVWATHVLNKMQSARKCVQDLDFFCKNELFNNSPDQKYGETNVFRQKLLKEQFFIDILAMILKETVSVEELRLLDKWNNSHKNDLLDPEKISEEGNIISRKSSSLPVPDLVPSKSEDRRAERDNVKYIEKKVQFCHTIYSLLVSICKGNYENEVYTFNLIPKFLIHCKYIPEAVECIISIIGSNETILTKMSENLKIDIDRNINRNIDDNIINVIINIKDSENLIDSNQKVNPSFFTGQDQSRISKPINLINFFLNLLKQKSETAANVHYLKFFRKICTQNKVGVTINQDMLYKIFTNNPNFVQRTMITFSCDDNDITAEFPAAWTGVFGQKVITFSRFYNKEQDAVVDSNNIKFLEEQLKLYSDLALSRNYLWKSLLEDLFPLQFVFNGIWNDQYSKTMRAALCMMALTVYIDHEPFNQLILPKMCRVYQTRKLDSKASKRKSFDLRDIDEEIMSVSVFKRENSSTVDMKNQLFGLINNIVTYLEKEVEAISDELSDTVVSKKKKVEKEIFLAVLRQDQALKTNTRDFLNDVLLLNVVQMFSKLIKFDILGMTKKQNMFYTVTNTFVRLLEYDNKNPAYSYMLMKQRKENVKKRIEIEKNKNAISMSGLKNLLNSVVDNVTEITGTIGGFLNLTQNKLVAQNKKGPVDEIEDQNQFNNPTMRNMISLQYSLERLKYDEEKKDKADIEVKLEVLDTLDFLLDMRKNYMVTNFLAWHQGLEGDMKKYTKQNKIKKFDRKLEKKFNDALPEVLPPIAKTGLLDIDEKFASVKEEEDNDDSGFKKFINSVKNVGIGTEEKKFKDFAKDSGDFAYDLDSLVLGHESGHEDVTSELLPSLLVTFLITKDSVLESRVLDVMMRLFNQRAEMFDALQKLEILFDPVEIRTYQFVEKQTAKLKDYVEKLEIWLESYVISEVPGKELEEVINIIKNLTLLLDSNNSIDENGELKIHATEGDEEEEKEKEKSVSSSRQNIMKYLRTHRSMIMVSKEGVHELEKVILDDEVNIAKKRRMVELFTRAHEFLRDFCRNNEGNQKILAEYKDVFIEHARLDVGQIDLLCAIYNGNKMLCESISENFLEKFIALIESEGRQASFLKFFMVIQKSKDVYIQENQIRVFRALVSSEDNDAKSIYKTLYMNLQPKNDILQFEFNDFVPSNENKDIIDKLAEFGFRDTYRDEPFTYHEKLLSVLIETMKGSEGFNMNKAKLKTVFSFQYLMELLIHPDGFTSTSDQPNTLHESISDKLLNFKPEELQKIRMSLEHTEPVGVAENAAEKYQLFEERKHGFTKIKGKLIEFIIELFFGPNTKIEDPMLTQKHFVRLVEKEIARFEDLNPKTEYDPRFLDYFFGSVLGLCNEYISKLLNVAVLEEEGRRKDNIALYKLAVVMVHKLSLFEKKLHVHHLRNLKSFMEKYIDFSNQEYEDRVDMLLTGEDGQSPFLRPRVARGGTFLLEKEEISWASKNNWDRLMGIITNGQAEWQKGVDDEKRALSQAVLNFSKLFSPEDQEKYKISLNPKDLIKKFIKYLQYGSSNKAKKETMISTLQTLIKMVDVEDPKEKAELQNMLDKYEATKMVLTVLSDSSNLSMDPEVFNSFLELGIKLLEGGNARIQKNIYNYFITFQKSEAIFAKFSNVIATFSNRLKRLNNTETLELEIVDLAEEYSNLGPVILENILRLLQLFTEGHYSDLQNYIRVQTNSRNNYDMVSAVTELLRSYLNHMSQANYESIMRCLATLAEFVQGPCHENQQSLIDGKFFEVVNTILTYSFKNGRQTLSPTMTKERLTRKQTFVLALRQSMERWMVTRIKYQTLILVTSLLEQRKDDTTIKRIMRSLPIDIVKKHLGSVWKVYKSLYGTKYVTESLGHYDGDPKVDRERAKPKENQKYGYYDLITESGFAAYFLLESYYEVLDHDDDERVLNEVMSKKMMSNTQKDNLIKSSVFGQIGSFLFSIIKQGLDTAESLKNQINKNILHLGLDEDEGEKLRKELRQRELVRDGMKFFAEHSAHIEVVRNKEIEKIYFYLQPFCHVLPKEIKTTFHDNVNRVSVQSKVSGLMQSSDEIIRTMEHEYKLGKFFNEYKLVSLFANHVTLWQDLSFTVSIIVNFFILVSYSSRFSDESNELRRRMAHPRLFLDEKFTNTEDILAILGLIMLVSSLFVVLFYLVKKAPLVIEKVWRNSEKNESQKQKKKGLISRLIGFLFKLLLISLELLQSYEIVYFTLYGIMAIVGVVVHPFFFAFHLTVIVIRYPTLKDVIRAFWEPRKALGLTFVLFIILEYIASLFAFTCFVEDYENNCDSTLECFLYTFDFTFKANGGIGGQLDSLHERPPGVYSAGRFFFDNIFNIALVIVLVSIVAGIIIDTFGSLRETDHEKNSDIHDLCFVCGNDKETFDRKSDAQGGFKQHIKIDHYMWNYVFYIAYLKCKDKLDYTGVESYIAKKVKTGEVSWFPLRKALVLEDIKDEEEKQVEQLNQIEANIGETMKISSNFNRNLKYTVRKLEKSHHLPVEEIKDQK